MLPCHHTFSRAQKQAARYREFWIYVPIAIATNAPIAHITPNEIRPEPTYVQAGLTGRYLVASASAS